MLGIENIRNLVATMTEDINSNIRKLKNAFGSLEYVDDSNQSLLHILVDNKYDEHKCFLAIQSLLKIGLNPNLEDDFNYNFIQTALYAGYSETFIIKIIKESLKYNLDINHVDSDQDTIMHTAIYSDDYLGEVINIYQILIDNGFDSMKLDHEGRNLVEAMIYQKQYSKEQIIEFKELFLQNTKLKEKTVPSTDSNKLIVSKNNMGFKQLSDQEIAELEKYGTILNKKKYFSSPTVRREKELKELLINLMREKKSPLIVGKSGVGKTVIVDELVYRIQTGQVPKFLSNKIIFDIDPNEIVAGQKYVGEFNKKMKKLMKLYEKYDVILFIDEIHTIYGTGAGTKGSIDMAAVLKRHLDQTPLKIIGTTTEKEYAQFFSPDALKRRFEKIIVKEPSFEVLLQIIHKVMEDYSFKDKIPFRNEQIKDQIAKIIMELTSEGNRDFQDIVHNPDLSITIIDKAFAIAKFYNSELIEPDHFIESFDYGDGSRLSKYAKEHAISKLKKIRIEKHPVEKVLTIDFQNKRKK